MMLLIDTKPENNNECMYSIASAQRHWLVKQQIVVVGGGLSSRSKSNIIAAGEQWRTKWKNLKKKYLEEKLMASKSGKDI